jgi:hypothetical protein
LRNVPIRCSYDTEQHLSVPAPNLNHNSQYVSLSFYPKILAHGVVSLKIYSFGNLSLAFLAFVILDVICKVLVVQCVDMCVFLRAGTKFAAKLARG